jgi:hypothetical protein
LKDLATFCLSKHTLLSHAVRACVREDPWLSYADGYPSIEPLD